MRNSVFLTALFLVACVCLVVDHSVSLRACQKTPSWRLSGRSFPKAFSNHIKLVALLRASCGFCVSQAKA